MPLPPPPPPGIVGPDIAAERGSVDDERTVRSMRRRTSPFGRVVVVLLLLSLAGLAGIFVWRQRAHDRRMQAVEAAGRLQDKPQMLRALRAAWLETDYDDVKRRILRNLAHFRDDSAIDLMIEGLEGGALVRREAALGLAHIGLPAAAKARDPLFRQLPHTDKRDRLAVVWALTVLRDKRAADAVLEAFVAGTLQRMPGYHPDAVVAVLGVEGLSRDHLLFHSHKSVRQLVAQALAESEGAAAETALAKVLLHEMKQPTAERSAQVLQSAAGGLGRIASPRAASLLFRLLHDVPSMRRDVLAALQQQAGAPALARLLTAAARRADRRDLTRLLAESHDPRGAAALANQLDSDDAKTREHAVFGLVALGDARAVPALLAWLGAADRALADKAAAGLRSVAHPDSAARIAAAGARHPKHRAALWHALGRSQSSSVVAPLLAGLKGDDASAAALALAELGHAPAHARFLSMAPRPAGLDMREPSPESEIPYIRRRAALRALRVTALPAATPVLRRILEDRQDDVRLQRLAATALGHGATIQDLQAIIRTLNDASVPERDKDTLAPVLWQPPRAALAPAFWQLLKSHPLMSVRRAAALALGYLSDPAYNARLRGLLVDPERQSEAVLAVVLGAGADAPQVLLEALRQDATLRLALAQALGERHEGWWTALHPQMFTSGSLWRRAQMAAALRDAASRQGSRAAWQWLIETLRQGWEDPPGFPRHFVRQALWRALTGEDATRRQLAAEVLADLPERGWLLRARDEGGAAASAARAALRQGHAPR
ncbi:MAG: hypothetical protein ACPGUV_05110 [Polyangiales bacterium]